MMGRQYRYRSPESVIEEIRVLREQYDIHEFEIVDDCFNLNRPRMHAILQGLIDFNDPLLRLQFPNGLRSDLLEEQDIVMLRRAGTNFISFAIETASTRLQKLIHKNLGIDKAIRAITLANKAGIFCNGFFMLGFPTETEEEALGTIEYAKRSALCGATFFQVVYYPGTKLYELAQSMGFFKDERNEVNRDYVQVSDGPYCFSAERMIELKKKAIAEFAFTKERIMRVEKIMPPYFTRREIDGLFMAYVVSAQARWEDIEDEYVRARLKRHFVIADRFSRKREFYV